MNSLPLRGGVVPSYDLLLLLPAGDTRKQKLLELEAMEHRHIVEEGEVENAAH